MRPACLAGEIEEVKINLPAGTSKLIPNPRISPFPPFYGEKQAYCD